jgi:hypothetical protein
MKPLPADIGNSGTRKTGPAYGRLPSGGNFITDICPYTAPGHVNSGKTAPLSGIGRHLLDRGQVSKTEPMTAKLCLSYTDRLERAAAAKRFNRGELEDLAEYAQEIVEWANELDTKTADFAAEVEMYYAPGVSRGDRAEIRARLTDRAAEVAGALRALFQYGEPPLG